MPAIMSAHYAVILAGGSGTRFWPLSRNNKPKQLLDLFGSGTLLNQTIARLDGLVPPENIFILTNQLQVEEVRKVASELPPENIFAEPAKRDTAPAVALGIGLVAARDPEASMMILPSDQLIQDTAAYQQVMGDALAVADATDALLTVGIKPTWACPSFGYVERGGPADTGTATVTNTPHEVVRFREKPNPEQAQEFLDQGSFTWNAGMFIWSVKTAMAELAQHTPELADFIGELQQSENVVDTVAQRFPELTPISIDYALMEKANKVYNIEATFDWDDVGSWISVAKYLENDANENSSNKPVTTLDSNGNIIFNATDDKHIALLGAKNMIVVQTNDALLVADRHQADAIKKIVDQLPEELL